MPMATDPEAPRAAPTRRRALGALGVAAWSACSSTRAEAAQQVRSDTLQVLTAWQTGGRAYAGVWTPQGTRWATALPDRAHQLLPLLGTGAGRRQQALVVARRPGEYLARVDTRSGRLLQLHTMESDRYLGGHAVQSPDGRFIFTTESDGDTGQGLIAQRDTHTLEVVREFASGGIGPHALLWANNGELMVANGGILTLPETGRRKRNIPRMEPNLSRIGTQSGQIREQFALDDRFLSLRHLAMAPDGTLAVALQAEHADPELRQAAPALAILGPEGLKAVPWTAPPAAWQGYAGDICWAGDTFWISSTYAGQVAGWSSSGEWRGAWPLQTAGALMPMASGFLAGGSQEALLGALPTGTTGSTVRHRLGQGWDNHAVLLSF
ncbi:DUF1513 domain-containing protein [Rhodoferax sp.]|uniref:DUF1513 domain-containing protein n=1 Tax=Rhodoferax sp. TaxID=50421 RepID=UPI0026008A53|nr:DUF1513 domain-containing protein [Rhodoferax sp.]